MATSKERHDNTVAQLTCAGFKCTRENADQKIQYLIDHHSITEQAIGTLALLLKEGDSKAVAKEMDIVLSSLDALHQ